MTSDDQLQDIKSGMPVWDASLHENTHRKTSISWRYQPASFVLGILSPSFLHLWEHQKMCFFVCTAVTHSTFLRCSHLVPTPFCCILLIYPKPTAFLPTNKQKTHHKLNVKFLSDTGFSYQVFYYYYSWIHIQEMHSFSELGLNVTNFQDSSKEMKQTNNDK